VTRRWWWGYEGIFVVSKPHLDVVHDGGVGQVPLHVVHVEDVLFLELHERALKVKVLRGGSR